jgi:hypothetical protein
MIGAGRSGVDLLENAFLAENWFRRGEIVFDAALLANPLKISFDSLLQAHYRSVSSLPNYCGIGYQMPYFTWPKLAIRDRCEPNLQRIGDHLGNLSDCDRSTGSDVHGLSV